jgi:hypothetical protein
MNICRFPGTHAPQRMSDKPITVALLIQKGPAYVFVLHGYCEKLKGRLSSGAVVVRRSVYPVSAGSVLQRLDRPTSIASTSTAPIGVSLSARIRRILESGGHRSKLQHSHRRPMFGHGGDGSEKIPSLP